MTVKITTGIDFTRLLKVAATIGHAENRAKAETNIQYQVSNEIDQLDYELRTKGQFSLSGNLDYWGNRCDAQEAKIERGTQDDAEAQDAAEGLEYATQVFTAYATRQQALKVMFQKLTGTAWVAKAERVKAAKSNTRRSEALAAAIAA